MSFLQRRISRNVLWLPVLAFVVLLYVLVWSNRQAITDWARLQGYKPSTQVAALAEATTMTPKGRTFFYINNPQIEDKEAFNQHCRNQSEQSIVLGCYLGNRNGIYLYKVTDPALKGVEEVTAAHEMLHQAYDRLSKAKRERIDVLLIDFAEKQIADEAIKEQIALYKTSEPNNYANELHSLLGTQVADLPVELETYYKQYFKDRKVIVGLYTHYQLAFTELQDKIREYDKQLALMKPVIDTLEAELKEQRSQLDAQTAELEALKRTNVSAYNARVPGYNAFVDSYNTKLDTLKTEISQYNAIVEERNAIAVEERQLQQGLSSRQLQDAPEE